MLGMLRMITANIKRVLRMQVIASEAIFAITKVKVTKGTLRSTGVWRYEWVRGHQWDSGHVAGTPMVISL
jgi:hypothetical protein